MELSKLSNLILKATLPLLALNAHAADTETPQQLTRQFTERMASQHGFDRQPLEKLLQQAKVQRSILKAISSPAEGKPWYQYRKIFLTPARIRGGIEFWREHEATLAAVQAQYGVPAEIIVAIIGVETRYGGFTGRYRVLDALSTLGFHYPKRARFFRSELEQFLLLCQEESIDPLTPTGSYAGAMGLPQFIPSSYRNFAADFEGDQKRDIWHNPADAIASVANYFVKHGWQNGAAVAYPVTTSGNRFTQALQKGLKPDRTAVELMQMGVQVPRSVAADTPVRLLKFDGVTAAEYWLGLNNFYVITRYNHSPLYAMAVYQLAQAIRQQSQNPAFHTP